MDRIYIVYIYTLYI